MSATTVTMDPKLVQALDNLGLTRQMIMAEKQMLHNPPFDGAAFIAHDLADTKIKATSRYSQDQIDGFNTRWANELKAHAGDYSKLHKEMMGNVNSYLRASQAIETLETLVEAVNNPGSRVARNVSSVIQKLSTQKRLAGGGNNELDFVEELEAAKNW